MGTKKFLIVIAAFFILIFGYFKFESEISNSIFIIRNSECFNIDEIMRGPIAQDDPRILEFVRKKHLVPPSDLPYNLKNPQISETSMGQSTIIKQILGNMTHGFFIECGAYNGEDLSNTLNLEREFGWNGLLIEANTENYRSLKSKNRKAWISHVCLSMNEFPSVMRFIKTPNPKARKLVEPGKKGGGEKVQCIPFYTLMAALNVKTIDYFSLDIEGFEYRFLQTVPLDKLHIKTFSIEYRVDKAGEEGINEFMALKGYYPIAKVINKNKKAHDNIYVHKSVVLQNLTFIQDIVTNN